MSSKISVIIPAYNIAEYLPRCLDSVINQTYKNIEIIVISDGSLDGTNEVINEYADKDNRIVPVFKDNTGVSDTRNRGLEIATGDYIGFVDGDDYIEPIMYEHLLDNAVKYDADISHCGYQMVFPSRIDYYYNTGKTVIQDNIQGVKDLLSGDFVEPGLWNKLYKKRIISDVRLDKEIKINEDVLFNFFAFLKSNKSVYEDSTPYHYVLRKNSAATSKINNNKLFDPIKVRKEIFEYCQKNCNIELQSIAYSNYLSSVINLSRIISENSDLSINKDVVKKYRQEINRIKVKGYLFTSRTKVERFMFLHMAPVQLLVYNLYDSFLSKNKDKYEVK